MHRRVALVTGGNRGIGEAIARRLRELGHPVAIAGRDESALERVAKDIGASPFRLDVTDADEVSSVLAAVRKALGPISILVQSAGIASSAKFPRVTDADLQAILAVNVTACFRLARGVIEEMVDGGWGRIVQIASNAGLTGYAYTSAYCVSKHAVVGLVRALAAEYPRSGVTINAICPGFVDTEMTARSIETIAEKSHRTREEARAALEALSPQKRLIAPAEIAAMVELLVSDGGRGIHGQALAVDGGQVLH